MAAEAIWTSRTWQAAAGIGTAILSGRYPPGQVLPREADLAAQMGVSRSTLREAMKVLASKSLVEIAPRRGTVVLPRTAWNVLDADVLDWSGPGLADDPRLVVELMELRATIEPAAAAAAARDGTAVQKAAVHSGATAMQALADSTDIEAKIDIDLAWHVAVAEASNNRFLASIIRAVAHALRAHLRLLNRVDGNYEGNLANHMRVAEAIARSDAATAQASMRALVNQARNDTLRMQPGQNPRRAAG